MSDKQKASQTVNHGREEMMSVGTHIERMKLLQTLLPTCSLVAESHSVQFSSQKRVNSNNSALVMFMQYTAHQDVFFIKIKILDLRSLAVTSLPC